MNYIENNNSFNNFVSDTEELSEDQLFSTFNNGDFKSSKRLSEILLKKDQTNCLAFNILGLSESSLGQKDIAEKTFLKGIFYNPLDGSLCNNLANLYLETKEYKKAKDFSYKATSLSPNCSKSYFTLGVSLNACNKLSEAICAFKKSFKLDKNNYKALLNIGNIYKDRKKFTKALEVYRQYQKLFPKKVDGYYSESTLHLRSQRFKLGWGKYEIALKDNSRNVIDGYHTESKSLWDGKPFDGTLLIYGEQGIGDQIFFGTILFDLMKFHSRIILKVDKRLKNLFENNFQNIHIYSENENVPEGYYQKYIAIGSLCKFLRKDLKSFENTTFSQFKHNKKPFNLRKCFKNKKPVIGVSWYTKSHETGINRSLKPIELSRIINESNLNFVNLQYGEYEEQIREIQQLTNGALFTYSDIDLTNDFENLSNLILECDIVLTIDNTLAHLSSSLGQKTWILLPHSANFRWFENTSNSLWYKSSTLIRQTPDRKWKTSIDEIINKLKRMKSHE